MLKYPNINPIALKIGPLSIHWYGLMYLCGFALAWALASWRARVSEGVWNSEQVADLIFYAALN